MASRNQDFRIHAGDSKLISVTVRDEDDALQDLTGATIAWQMAKTPRGPAEISKSTGGSGITLGGTGIFNVSLDPSDTVGFSGLYYHEAQVTDVTSNVTTVTTGTVYVEEGLI